MRPVRAACDPAPSKPEVEDQINRIMAARKMLPNASYFAFTATPKDKTLEIFGEAFPADGQTKKAVCQLRHTTRP